MFSQNPYHCKLEWGICGLKRAVERQDIIVIVDCLSFTTSVVVAVYNACQIIPCSKNDDLYAIARKYNAVIAVSRSDVPAKGTYSLSPETFMNIEKQTKIILPSLNGSTCSRAVANAPLVIAGTIVNAQAVAELVESEMDIKGTAVTVVACGEREKGDESKADLRFAIEDYLGAGAILSYLDCKKSPEAELCSSSYLSQADKIEELIWDSVSGRELRMKGFEEDVKIASNLNSFPVVPVLQDGIFK